MTSISLYVDWLLASQGHESLPASLENLALHEYVAVSRAFIQCYPMKYASYSTIPLSSIKQSRARVALCAFVDINRSSLTAIHPLLVPAQAQRDFIRTEIFQRRKELEIVYSEFWGLVQQACFATSPERPITDFFNEIPDAHAVDPSIRSRDNYRCKCTGYLTAFWSDKRKTLPEPTLPNERYAAPLQIVHGIPYELGDHGFDLLSRLLGIPLDGWNAQSPGNAILLHKALACALRLSQIYFEEENGQMVIRFRMQPEYADPTTSFNSFPSLVHEMKYCDTALIGAMLRQTPPSQIPQPEYRYYLVLKLLGDILWTTAEAFPDVMLQEQEELERESMMDVTEDNVDVLWRRLTEYSTFERLESSLNCIATY